jgi:hypothetical protein
VRELELLKVTKAKFTIDGGSISKHHKPVFIEIKYFLFTFDEIPPRKPALKDAIVCRTLLFLYSKLGL